MNASIRLVAIDVGEAAADRFPESGPSLPDRDHWSEADYLALRTHHLVELAGGRLEALLMPTRDPQEIVLFLYDVLKRFVAAGPIGNVLIAPDPVRIRDGRFREPDLLFIVRERVGLWKRLYADAVDLVMEVVSEGSRTHDLETNRREYTEAGIAEYGIVDPAAEVITVLAVEDGAYAVRGVFGRGSSAASRRLPGLVVDVAAVFDAARR